MVACVGTDSTVFLSNFKIYVSTIKVNRLVFFPPSIHRGVCSLVAFTDKSPKQEENLPFSHKNLAIETT